MTKDASKTISKEVIAVLDYLSNNPPPKIKFIEHTFNLFELYVCVNGVDIYVAYRKEWVNDINLFKMTIGNYRNLIEPHEKQMIAQVLLHMYNEQDDHIIVQKAYDAAKDAVRKQLIGVNK